MHLEERGQRPGLSPFRRLLVLLRPERRDILVVVAFAIGVGILTLATPVAVQALVNFVAFGGLVQPLIILGLLLFSFLLLAGGIRVFKTWVVDVLQRRIFVRVAIDLSNRLPRVRVDAFDRGHGPELVNRFFDVLTVQKASATLLLDGVAVVLQAIIGLLILAFYHPILLAFDLLLLMGIAFVLFVLGKGAVRTAIAESKAKYAVAASLEEIARNPTSFKMAGGAKYAHDRTDALAVQYVKTRERHFAVVLRQVVGAVALQAIAGTALLTLGGWLVIQGQLTLGQLVAAELIVSTVLASFAKTGKQLESYYDLLAGVDKLGQLQDLPLERDSGEPFAPQPEGASVQLQDVEFNYGDRQVLKSITTEVQPGERVCVLGGHGSGKSTLADLLYGLRFPTRGQIALDGIDVREMSLSTLRNRACLVKGFEVIEGSIEANVQMNRPHVTAADVRKALSSVGLLEEIRSLPDGLSTQLLSTGAPLSFGQARRLMLARAMAGKPGLLIVDDLLDDLDDAARHEAIIALTRHEHIATVIVFSRSARVAEHFDQVIRLDNAEAARYNGQVEAHTVSWR
jgi:ABC-type bacteriocin/lantibiotic exporter with double-glycine peptidase domain